MGAAMLRFGIVPEGKTSGMEETGTGQADKSGPTMARQWPDSGAPKTRLPRRDFRPKDGVSVRDVNASGRRQGGKRR